MTQSTSSSDDAFKDSLNFVKKLWSGMNVPGMSTSSMPLPPMSLEELDKRIQELKSVEAWLNMNTSMLRNTIHALEVQRATLATLHAMANTMQGAEAKQDGTSADFVNQSAAWWNAMQEQFKQALSNALTTTNPENPSASTVRSAAKDATKNVKSTRRKTPVTSKTDPSKPR